MTSAAVHVRQSDALERRLIGLGVQWNPADSVIPEPTWAAERALELSVRDSRFGIARVMISVPSAPIGSLTGSPTQDRRLRRILDHLRRLGVVVELGVWSMPSDIASPSDLDWLSYLTNIVRTLVHDEGYFNVKLFNFINEPNGAWSIPSDQWAGWSDAVVLLADCFQTAGLSEAVTIVGPDTVYADDWVPRTARSLGSVIAAYQVHLYGEPSDLVGNAMQARVAALVSDLAASDAGKPLIVGELGFKGPDFVESADQHHGIGTTAYAIGLANLIVQCFNGGASAVIPWMSHDGMHVNAAGDLKKWGYMNTLRGRTFNGERQARDGFRPWYYATRRLSLAMPFGSSARSVVVEGSDQVVACSSTSTAGEAFVVVNSGADSVELVLPSATRDVHVLHARSRTRLVAARPLRPRGDRIQLPARSVCTIRSSAHP